MNLKDVLGMDPQELSALHTASHVVNREAFIEAAISEDPFIEVEEIENLLPIAGSIQLMISPGANSKGLEEAKAILHGLPPKNRKVILRYLNAIAQDSPGG